MVLKKYQQRRELSADARVAMLIGTPNNFALTLRSH